MTKNRFAQESLSGISRNKCPLYARITVRNGQESVSELGKNIHREGKPFRNETDIENELVTIFRMKDKSNLIYTSGQNIDRIVSTYRACIRSGKILVLDVYVATILKELSSFAGIPYPSDKFNNLQVMFPYYTSKRLADQGDEKFLYQFKTIKSQKKKLAASRINMS